MKYIIALTSIFLCLTYAGASQRRKPPDRAKSTAARPRAAAPAIPPIIGTPVTIVTKTGEQISGQVSDFGSINVRVRQGDLESTVPVESIATLRFGATPVAPAAAPASGGHSPEFGKDAESVLASFQAMDSATQSGTDYSDYGRRLIELRRTTERFVGKYAGSEDQTETRLAALLSAALGDYSWARTIWTLRLGQGPAATVGVADSPALTDILELYPDLIQLGPRNKLPADRLVASLWKQGSLKIGRGRRLLEQGR